MPGKMRECDGCHKIMRSDNLKNHTRKCNGLNQNLNVSNENIRYPFADNSSKMSKSINPKISALVDAIVNEEPISKDPDGSSTSRDPDDNDSGIEPMDMTTKDMKFEDEDDDEDEDEDDDNESYSGIEPMDMTARQFGDDDEDEDEDDEDDDDEDDDNDQLSNEKSPIITFRNLSEEIKIIIKKLSQLFQESKRGVKQNRGKLILLIDLLKDCKIIDDDDYEKLYLKVESICNKY